MKEWINKVGIIFFSLLPIAIVASTASSSLGSVSSQFKPSQASQTKLKNHLKIVNELANSK